MPEPIPRPDAAQKYAHEYLKQAASLNNFPDLLQPKTIVELRKLCATDDNRRKLITEFEYRIQKEKAGGGVIKEEDTAEKRYELLLMSLDNFDQRMYDERLGKMSIQDEGWINKVSSVQGIRWIAAAIAAREGFLDIGLMHHLTKQLPSGVE